MSKIFCGTAQISEECLKKPSKIFSDIRLFKIKLSSYYHLVPNLMLYLTEAEIQRAEKYHFNKDSNRFLISRGLLKFILAQYTGLDISEIIIEKDENKKPFLPSHKSVYFNVSHSEDYAIIAVSNTIVGVDVEYINKDFDFTEILTSVYCSKEIQNLLKADSKVKTFYKYWTRKEAIVKAIGIGINDNLAEIPVMDGYHTVKPKLLGGMKYLKVLSFALDKNYIASIAISDENSNFDKLLICNIPSSLEGLLSFCS